MKEKNQSNPKKRPALKKIAVERLVVGQLQSNCYLLWDKLSKQAVIIDPGDDADSIILRLQALDLHPRIILATHGHFDHAMAAAELKMAFDIPFLIHQADLPILKRMEKTVVFFTGAKESFAPQVDDYLTGNEIIKFGKEKIRVICTPGHTPGGVSFLGRGVVFTGDTLFKQAIGRTEASYSSSADLKKSLQRLFKLPAKTIVYPGHGESTTIGKEKRNLLE